MDDVRGIIQIANQIGLTVINDERKYWLVRTKGGRFFEEFFFEGYVALGWNAITKENLKCEDGDFDAIKTAIKETLQKDKEIKVPGYPAGQIVRFAYEMKKGDIVLVPNKDSNYVAFGELVEDQIYEEQIENAVLKEKLFDETDENDIIDESCPFIKRRKVKWITTINSDKLDPYLYRVLHSHNAVSDASKYANYIDRSLYSYYFKNGKIHMTFEVEKTNNIPAVQLISGLNSIVSGIDILNQELSTDFNKTDIDIKLNVQSPGPIEYIFNNPWAGISLGILIAGIVGAKFNFKFTKEEQNGQIESPGLLGRILEFIQQKHDNKLELRRYEREFLETKANLKLKVPSESDENKEE